MVQRIPGDIDQQVTDLLADNTTGDISAEDVRSVLSDVIDSTVFRGTNTLSDTSLLMVSADGQTVQDASISETADRTLVGLPTTFLPSEVRIGSTGLRTAADVIYLESSRTHRTFFPVGTEFTVAAGTSAPMSVTLDAVEELPAGANQTDDSQSMTLSAGQTFSFAITGATGVQHLLQEFTVRTSSVGGGARLKIFVGGDNTGELVLDNTYTFTTGDNTITLESYPYFLDGETYFVEYTATQDVTFLGTGTGVNFRPYTVNRGWPYSETTVGLLVDSMTTSETTWSSQRIQQAIDAISPNMPVPRFTAFSVDIPDTLTAGTPQTGTHTFTWSIENIQNVSGTLTISQDGTDLSTTVDPALGTIDLTINDFTLAVGESETFTISGSDVQTPANTFTRNDVKRVPQPHEFLYEDRQSTNNFATVDISLLTAIDITASGQTITVSRGAGQVGDFFGILVPADEDISEIRDTTFNQDITEAFTRTENARVINSINYNSYVLGPLQATTDTNYVVTIS